LPRDEGKEPGIRPPGDSQLPPIEDKDRPREPGRGPNKPKPVSEFDALLKRTLLQTILLKYPSAKSRVRQKVRNRKRGRSYRPTIYSDPMGDARREAKKTQTYRAPRPREASTWRGIPGIASGGDIAEAAGEITGYWLADKWLKRALGRNYPSDPGPRGRKRATATAGAPKRPGGGDRPRGRTLPRRLPAPLPKVLKPGSVELPEIGEVDGLPFPGTRPGRLPVPAPSGQARPATIPYPSRSTRPQTLVSLAPNPFPLATPRARPLRERVTTRAQARAQAQGQPLTGLNALGVPSIPTSGQDKCRCPKPKRKKGCTNPIISKSISGNVLTTKRELVCPPSSSKAR